MEAYEHLGILGHRVRDKVTGVQGFVVGVTYDLYGCIQAEVLPPTDSDNKTKDATWFDVNRLDSTVVSARDLQKPSIEDFRSKLGILGKKVEDAATGTKGVVTSVLFVFNGSDSLVIVNPGLDDKGLQLPHIWVHRERLVEGSTVMDPPNWVSGPQARGEQGPAERPL